MPCLIVPRSQQSIPSCTYNSRQETCVLVAEQGNDLIESCTCYREHVPRAPPPSPEFSSLTCAGPNEACPSASCALLLVDRKIEAHQARLSEIQHRRPLGSHSPAFMNNSVSGMKLEASDEPMHRMTSLRQVSSASDDDDDDDDMTVTNSSCPSSRSSGTNALVNDLASDMEVDARSSAIGAYYKRKIATSPQSATQPSCPKPPAFSLLNLRSSRDVIADAPSRFHPPLQSNDASLPWPVITDRQISFPKSIGSSAKPDIAALPFECKQGKTKSWPGPCSQLPGLDIASMHKATMRPISRRCDFACACCRKHKARCDGGMLSCTKCLSRSESCFFNRHSISLQPLEEHARGKEAMDEQQAATMEEERSQFSDYSTDEDDDGEKVASNFRLFNSLGRLRQKSKTRLSWGSLFSKS